MESVRERMINSNTCKLGSTVSKTLYDYFWIRVRNVRNCVRRQVTNQVRFRVYEVLDGKR